MNFKEKNSSAKICSVNGSLGFVNISKFLESIFSQRAGKFSVRILEKVNRLSNISKQNKVCLEFRSTLV